MKKILNLKSKKLARKRLRNEATIQEIILWSRLRRNQLGVKFRRQHSIGNYIVDFYCPKNKLIIEIDGWQHKKKENYDKKRDKYLESLGFEILRFWNNEINDNLEGITFKIEDSLK
jgi:very-short-patch-repair endonuclease